MKILFDFFPLLLFFGAYKFYDIYVATFVAIAASLIQVAWVWRTKKHFEPTHVVTLAVIVVFGGMTLLLRDDTFIKWKPTIVDWLFSVIIFGSHFFGKQTILQRLLGKQIRLPKYIWRNVNISWGLFFLFIGGLNLYVAFYFRTDLAADIRTDFWVNFKVFGLLALTLVFTVIQMALIARHIEPKNTGPTK